MQDFYPKEIYLDPAVQESPIAKRILAKFPKTPLILAANKSKIKIPEEHTRAKRRLYLTRYEGAALKSCQGMGDYVCCDYFTIALISDCHLECTYCILQDYLQNNPLITIHCNIDEIFSAVKEKILRNPNRDFRIGTGELSDSLALDTITEFSRDLVLWARELPNALIELKTKTANIQNLLGLDHRGRTVVSWSVNPQSYIDREEHKCDSLADRLNAARICADHGYPVAFHLDPLLHFEEWQSEYKKLIDNIAERFLPHEIAWVSIGSLRFTKGLRKISMERFPKSKIMMDEMTPSLDGKIRYFRPIREEMYATISQYLQKKIAKVPHYLCMETKAVWKNVFGNIPASNAELETHLSQHWKSGFTV